MKFNTIQKIQLDMNEQGWINSRTKSYEYVAYCTSDRCRVSKKYDKKLQKSELGTIKQVPRKESFCPECSHALFWNKVEKDAA